MFAPSPLWLLICWLLGAAGWLLFASTPNPRFPIISFSSNCRPCDSDVDGFPLKYQNNNFLMPRKVFMNSLNNYYETETETLMLVIKAWNLTLAVSSNMLLWAKQIFNVKCVLSCEDSWWKWTCLMFRFTPRHFWTRLRKAKHLPEEYEDNIWGDTQPKVLFA